MKVLQKAEETLKELCVLDDPFSEFASENYGKDADPFTGYGSVKSEYRGTDAEGNSVNRLAEGNSTLLDKTIYTQLNGEEVPIVSGKTYSAAKQSLIKAMTQLKLIKTMKNGK
ncbi:MAG: hypothetical protein SOW08_14595 [Lachnospiraceae bacterium]|nr:hypothetical protein [Lachnospiraceae bacterium]